MYAYCGNNPINRTDRFGYCYYKANGKWCHDNWEYIGGYVRRPDPGYYKGTTKSGIPLYVALHNNYSIAPNGIQIIDKRDTNLDPDTEEHDPDFQVISSFKIKDLSQKEEILNFLETYNEENPSIYQWTRTKYSMLAEWIYHNWVYNIGIQPDHTRDCDFNNDDAGKDLIALFWDKIREKNDII